SYKSTATGWASSKLTGHGRSRHLAKMDTAKAQLQYTSGAELRGSSVVRPLPMRGGRWRNRLCYVPSQANLIKAVPPRASIQPGLIVMSRMDRKRISRQLSKDR